MGGLYVCRSESEIPKEKFRLKVKLKQKAFFMGDTDSTITPTESFHFGDYWYYIFMGGISEVISFDVDA